MGVVCSWTGKTSCSFMVSGVNIRKQSMMMRAKILQKDPENARLKCVHKPAILQWVGGWVCMSEGYNTTGS